MNTWVVDLDGCLCDDSERRLAAGITEYVPNTDSTIDWETYFNPDLILKDRLNTVLAKAISLLPDDHFVLYLTGREGSDLVRNATESWLCMHDLLLPLSCVWMREVGDRRPAEVYKRASIHLFKELYPYTNFTLGVSDRNEDLLAYYSHNIPGLLIQVC